MKLLLASTFFLLVLLDPSRCGAQGPSSTIPAFTFYKLDGSAFAKSNLSSTAKIIFIFIDIDCKPCQKAIEELEKNYNEFKLISLYVISLSPSDDIQKFIEKNGKKLIEKKNFTLLQDKDRQFINKFSPTKYPAFYIYSPQGNLIQYFAGATKIKELIKAIK